MLYLFGRLALSDSLDYHENFQDDDIRPAAPREPASAPEPEARAAVGRRLHRGAHLPPAGRACPGCPGN